MSKRTFHDPQNYDDLNIPVAENEAQAVVDAFFADLRELRQKHRIPDVECIVRLNVMVDGEPKPHNAEAFFGNSVNAIPMLKRTLHMVGLEAIRAIAEETGVCLEVPGEKP